MTLTQPETLWSLSDTDYFDHNWPGPEILCLSMHTHTCTYKIQTIIGVELAKSVFQRGHHSKYKSYRLEYLLLTVVQIKYVWVEIFWPGARSLAWLDERASGRLWRSRFIRLKPMGMSGSDMVSRFSAEAKETLLAWSARAGCVGLSRVTRGVRVCRTRDKKLGEGKKRSAGTAAWDVYFWKVINELEPTNVERANKRKNKMASGNQCKETKQRLKKKESGTAAQINSLRQTKAAFTSSSTNRCSTKRNPASWR